MSAELAELLQQRVLLQNQIAGQRVQFAATAQHWKKPLALADQGLKGVRWLQSHPLALLGVVAVVWLRRGGVVSVAMGVWRGWRWYRQAKNWLDRTSV